MRILLVADQEDDKIWSQWENIGKKRLEGVDLILSAGDIKPQYLEFLATMLGVPCLYVCGNHDDVYFEKLPEGCVCIEDRIAEVVEYKDSGRVMLKDEAIRASARNSVVSDGPETFVDRIRQTIYMTRKRHEIDPEGVRIIRIAGLGGSMRYRMGLNMYSEDDMAVRIRNLRRRMLWGRVSTINGGTTYSRDLAQKAHHNGAPVDILLTHAPCKGHGDMSDLAHQGFECFNKFLEDYRPSYHCYAHIHMEYGRIKRESEHPSGTHLINVSGMYILDI